MISIIVPVYKVEKYLPRCIESLIKQTYKDIQIILVDDGSPDRCGEICDAYAAKDNRINVIHQINNGVSAARNAGLDLAKGEYIGFVDPDDWVDAEMYEGMLSELIQTGADLAICGYDYYNESGKIDEKRVYCIKESEIIDQREVMKRFADMPPSIRHGVWNKLFKSNLLHSQSFIVGLHSSEDVIFLTEYVCNIKTAVVIHKPYYKNLVRQGSATHGGLNIVSLADSFDAHDKMYKSSVERYPELKNHCLAFLLDVCMLKYDEAKNKLKNIETEQQKPYNQYMKKMKKYIKKRALMAIFDTEIYWKTRIYYLLFG